MMRLFLPKKHHKMTMDKQTRLATEY